MKANTTINQYYKENFQFELTSDTLLRHLEIYNLSVNDIETAHFEIDLLGIKSLAALEITVNAKTAIECLIAEIISWPESMLWDEFEERTRRYIAAWLNAYKAGIDLSTGLSLAQAINFKSGPGIYSTKLPLYFMALLAEATSAYHAYLLDYYSRHHRDSGLPNAAVMREMLDTVLVAGQLFGLIYLAINLASSSKPADRTEDNQAIPEIVSILQKNLYPDCHLFQLENNEFAVLAINLEEAVKLDLLAAKLLRAFEATLHVNGRPYALKPWLGCFTQNEPESSVDNVCMKARLTLDHAMKSGRNITSYSPNFIEEDYRHRELERFILDAFEDGRFELYIQPIVNSTTPVCDYAEVLLRCNNANGFIPPPLIIDVLYKHGLGGKFVRWLLSTAGRMGTEIHSALRYPVCLSVNLTPDDLIGHELPFLLSQSLALWGLDARYITLEITENGLLLDEDAANQTIRQLIGLGCSIALDDFGTGYSSMTRLRNMPIDIIKIDQSFVRNIHNSSEDLEIVRAIILLAKSLGKEIVAEGVENIETLTILDELGCKKIQGYYYSKALAIEEFISWARAFEKQS